MGYSSWGRKESDTAEQLTQHFFTTEPPGKPHSENQSLMTVYS